VQLAASAGLCGYHQSTPPSGWAVENRILCDFVHRGIVPRGLAVVDRLDDGMAAPAAPSGGWRR
jgi:hypothetical protein